MPVTHSSRILAVETATEACSAALLWDGEVRERYVIEPQAHSRLILSMMQSLLAEAESPLSELDALAFGRGPGSFTGVRIRIAVAQGLALGADLPLRPVSTLHSLALTAHRKHGHPLVLTLLDARMGEVYAAGFDFGRKPTGIVRLSERVCSPQQLDPGAGQWLAAGPGLVSYRELLQEQLGAALVAEDGQLLPQAAATLSLARAVEDVAPEHLEPVYLRNQVTRKP